MQHGYQPIVIFQDVFNYNRSAIPYMIPFVFSRTVLTLTIFAFKSRSLVYTLYLLTHSVVQDML